MPSERTGAILVRISESEEEEIARLAVEFGGISRQDVVRLAVKRLAESSAK